MTTLLLRLERGLKETSILERIQSVLQQMVTENSDLHQQNTQGSDIFVLYAIPAIKCGDECYHLRFARQEESATRKYFFSV
jgi:hypothetical protein